MTRSDDLTSSSARVRDSSTVAWVRRHRVALILPAVVLVLLAVVTALGLSGTSSPLLATDGGASDSVMFGLPRAVRSDEWMVHTPMVVSQVENDAPRYGDIGVGSHDMSVLSDLPVFDWTMVFRPHQWGYLVLPLDNGYAFEWWSVAALQVLGVYVLLLILVRSVRWSVIGALFVFGSPYFHWWHTASAFATVGWMALGSACLLGAIDATRRRDRLLLAGASAYSLVCFALVLYPPWQISVALAIGIIVLGAIWSRWRAGAIRLRPMLEILVVGALSVVPLGLFYVTRRPALAAIANTIYPGARVVRGGTSSLNELVSSWFGPAFLRNDAAIRGVVFANESEASSFLFLGVALLVALPLVWRFVAPLGDRLRATIIATVIAMALFFTHMFVGLPTSIARFTMLQSVPEGRSMIGLGLASIVLLVLVGVGIERLGAPRTARVVAGVVLVVAMTTVVGTLASDFVAADAPFGWQTIVIALVLAVVPAAMYFWRPFVAVAILAVFGLLVSLPANPVVDGLSQTTQSDLVVAVRRVQGTSPTGGAWVAESYELASLVTTAGVANLSGVNLYPNVPAWELLDPSHRYEESWNRYSQAVWFFDTSVTVPEIRLVQADMIAVHIDPCDPALDRFDIRHVVTPNDLEAWCLQSPVDVRGPRGGVVHIFTRVPVGPTSDEGWTLR